jgi:hypothetical protein
MLVNDHVSHYFPGAVRFFLFFLASLPLLFRGYDRIIDFILAAIRSGNLEDPDPGGGSLGGFFRVLRRGGRLPFSPRFILAGSFLPGEREENRSQERKG